MKEIFMHESDIREICCDCSRATAVTLRGKFRCAETNCKYKSLEQHDAEVRKSTAKEILQKIIKHKFERCDRYDGEDELVEWEYCVPKEDLQFLIDEYGIEVDE